VEVVSCLLLSAFVVAIMVAAAKVQQANAPAKEAADAQIICPHCQTKGKVTTQRVRRKKGISGGKATGAILTGGASLVATGLSRKEWQTEARCGQCRSRWSF
jgi:hypothetical protein